MLGSIFIDFRNVSGKLAYEVGHTVSHFSNQAVLGVMIAKKELFQEIFKKYIK